MEGRRHGDPTRDTLLFGIPMGTAAMALLANEFVTGEGDAGYAAGEDLWEFAIPAALQQGLWAAAVLCMVAVSVAFGRTLRRSCPEIMADWRRPHREHIYNMPVLAVLLLTLGAPVRPGPATCPPPVTPCAQAAVNDAACGEAICAPESYGWAVFSLHCTPPLSRRPLPPPVTACAQMPASLPCTPSGSSCPRHPWVAGHPLRPF